MAQGLNVRQAPSSYHGRDWLGGGDDAMRPSASRPVSPPWTIRPRRHTESDSLRVPMPHSRSASNLLERAQPSMAAGASHNRSASNLLDSHHDIHAKLQQRSAVQGQTRSQGLAELVDFLRNYEPPADSFMSKPFDDEERGRWSRFKNMGGLAKRSKSVPKLSRHIQLPDSAVSGTTIGGHRHIAISIPVEASPFGALSRSQYPVYHSQMVTPDGSHGLHSNGRSGSPVRYINDRGVITVLRTVSEDRESRSSRSSFPGFRRSIPPSPGPPPSKALPPAGGLSRSNSSGKQHDYIGVLPEGVEMPLLGDYRYAIDPYWDLRQNHPAAAPPRRTSSAQGIYLPKPSAAMHRGSTTRPSIDGIIAKTVDSAPASSAGKKPRPISESSATEDEEPILGIAVHRHSMKLTPVLKVPKGAEVTVITESPLATRDDDVAQSPTPDRPQSRRDKVRSLKRRDMALLRSPSQTKSSRREAAHELRTRSSSDSVDDQATAKHIPADKYAPVNTLSPIMVVTNIEPTEEAPQRLHWDDRKPKDLEISTPGNAVTAAEVADNGKGGDTGQRKSLTISQARRARIRASLSPLSANKSCNPTPPLSPTRTPRRTQSTLDRTSLSRRREWNAARGKSQRVQEAMEAVKAKMQELSKTDESLENVQASQRDQEFLKLYEAYREHRLRDMERRVRRLERHGDVWMRALVPMLDNLNRTMVAGRYGDGQEDSKGWGSDDEISGQPARGRTKRRVFSSDKSVKRASISAGGDGTPRQADDLDGRDGSPRDSDDSGLDTLEPLMRELAGAAKERLRKNERPRGVAL